MSDKPRTLPAQPNLNWLKNRAKEKLQQIRAEQPSAQLAQAQLAIAREYGFMSWRKLREHVQAASANRSARDASAVPEAAAPLPADHPLVVAVIEAIQHGNLEALRRMLAETPGLARARVERSGGRQQLSLLHAATDWPGHFPNAAETVAALVSAGADVNARFTGPHAETPLHWAASSGDVAALDALLDHGADIEAPGAVIGGGTPLADAAAFGQWRAAHRLVERGAKMSLWQAAALGYMDRVTRHFAGDELQPWSPSGPRPGDAPDEVTHAFWCACHGGQRAAAEFLLQRGANLNWLGYDSLTPLGAARRSGADELAAWLVERGAV